MVSENADSALKEVSILYEDEHVAAVFKPAGLMVHPNGKSSETTLCDFIVATWPETRNIGEPLHLSSGVLIPRPGIVHRIDRETSGALLVAKTTQGFELLKKQFQDRTIKKIYNAFVYGKVMKEVGSITLPLGRSRGDFRQYTHPAKARGEMREALTYFTTLEAKKDFSYLELMPKTGRTHQLRAHLKAIQHPIVCDRIYAKSKPCGLGFGRVALHARVIEFDTVTGKRVAVEAPFPKDFEEAKGLFDASPSS